MKINRWVRCFWALLAVILLAGCWDNTEPENRAFVVTMGIDTFDPAKDRPAFEGSKIEERFTVTLEMPDVLALESKSSDDENHNSKKSSSTSLSAALYELDSYASRKLYYGHTKVVVFGEDILGDEELFKVAVDALERNREISRKILILACEGKAADVVGFNGHGESMMGMYISDFYKKNRDVESVAFRLDLDDLSAQLVNDGNVLIPKIEVDEDEGVKMGGAAIIKDFEITGWLTDMQSRGYLWMKGKGEGTQVITSYEDSYIPMGVDKNETKITFREEGGRLFCHAQVNVSGSIEEFRYADTSLFNLGTVDEICALYEQEIYDEIMATFELFQQSYGMDGFRLSDILRKFYYELYEIYGNDWDKVFLNLDFDADVKVEIKSTGALK